MDDPNTLSIILVIILIMLSAFFSASETAFSSVNKIRLKNYVNSGNKKAEKALKISEEYDIALSAILIGNNIVNIAAASIGTLLFTRWIGAEYGVAVSTFAMTIIVLIFGEITPKSLGKQHAEKVALGVAGFILFFMKLFYPVIWILMKIKNLLTKRFDNSESYPSVTEEELKYIIEEIEDEGILNEHESELVQSAIEFNDITVSEILTPRVDVIAIDKHEDPEVIKEIFFKEGYSRLPIYDKTIDNIIGVLNEKDFIKAYLKDKNVEIKKIIQQTIYVPPKKLISELLKELQRQKIHIAVVTDQYGGTLGIITLEDIIEELVGEIWDESDEVEIDIIKISDNKYRVSGDINIYDFFDQIDIDDSSYEGTSQTMSSWALEMFEKIPEKGESFTFENLTITVEDVVEQRIISFIITVEQT